MALRLRAPREIRYRMATTTGGYYYGRLLLLLLLLLRTGARRGREQRHPEEIARNGHGSQDIPNKYIGTLPAGKNEDGS